MTRSVSGSGPSSARDYQSLRFESGSLTIPQLNENGVSEQTETFNSRFSGTPVVMVACGSAYLSVHPNSVTSSGFHVQACAVKATGRSEVVSWVAVGLD